MLAAKRLLGLGRRRTCPVNSESMFCGQHWLPEVILMAVRRNLAQPLSGASALTVQAERGIDVSPRGVSRRVQTFGPRRRAEGRKHPRQPGGTLTLSQVFLLRTKGWERRSRFFAVDE